MAITPISHDRRMQPNYNTEAEVRNVIARLPEEDRKAWRHMQTQHMVPVIEHGLFINAKPDDFEPEHGGDYDVMPYEDFVTLLNEHHCMKVYDEPHWGYGARMSAPGYLDCTDWSVFGSPHEAVMHLINEYGDAVSLAPTDEEE